MPGQPDLTDVGFGVDARTLQVTDNDGIPSSLIVTGSLPITVSLTFEVKGLSLPLIINPAYEVTYAFNSRVGTPDVIRKVTRTLNTSGGPSSTRVVVSGATTRDVLPPGTLAPGIYDVVATVRFPSTSGIGAFAMTPVIQVI
ncbi:hypothetical protein [Streptomyces sp. NPDC058457]|uniref:hypothetical protein n=1 Tax=Streptomyces sp. NPDC058457 TaxID=3346507 RepID=UPI003668C2A1